MKVAILGNAKSIHIIRWVNGLSERGLDIHLISLDCPPAKEAYDSNVSFYKLHSNVPLGYYSAVFELRKFLKEINPDLLNAHYASGYGTLARLSGFHPLLLSVWGSDVFIFPEKTYTHKKIVESNLKNADAVASTSRVMLEKTNSIFKNQYCFVTPFGIDTKAFVPKEKDETKEVVIGTVKTLESVYGIDTLIKAFYEIQKKNLSKRTRLVIVGTGSKMDYYKLLAKSLELEEKIEFHGFVNHDEVPSIIQSFDVFVALSRSESFGVSVLEASACGLPVVVSDAEGFVEVVENKKTGLIVPKNDEFSAAKAMEELILDPDKRRQMGQFGREHVEKNYSWEKSLDIMIEAYNNVVYRDNHAR